MKPSVSVQRPSPQLSRFLVCISILASERVFYLEIPDSISWICLHVLASCFIFVACLVGSYSSTSIMGLVRSSPLNFWACLVNESIFFISTFVLVNWLRYPVSWTHNINIYSNGYGLRKKNCSIPVSTHLLGRHRRSTSALGGFCWR